MDISLANELDVLLVELESWDGQLLFGEGDSKQDLCGLLRTSFDSGVLANYQFDTSKYVGLDGVNAIRKDLMLAAKHCGYELVTLHSGNTNQAVGVERKLTLSCSCHRCYKGYKDKANLITAGNVLPKDVSCHGTVVDKKKKKYNNDTSIRPDVRKCDNCSFEEACYGCTNRSSNGWN